MIKNRKYKYMVQSTPTVKSVLKYYESSGKKDIGSLSQRKPIKGRMTEINSRVKHMEQEDDLHESQNDRG